MKDTKYLAEKSLEPDRETETQRLGVPGKNEPENQPSLSAQGALSAILDLLEQRMGKEVFEKVVLVGDPLHANAHAGFCLVAEKT